MFFLLPDWVPGQPDDYLSAEDCAVFMNPDFQWNDIPCNDKKLAICEKKYVLFNRLNCVLRRFQQYFNHITGTAHIIIVFPGFYQY